MRKTIATRIVNTLAELRVALDQLGDPSYSPRVREDEIYTQNADGDPLTVRLVEEILSDGSKVYNIVAE